MSSDATLGAAGAMVPVVSGTPAVPLPDADKVDVRRFAGYPAYGAGNAGFVSFRFFASYGLLEFRMNNLAAAEVAVVRKHLANCRALEAAVVDAGERLSTDKAAVWTRNRSEVTDRDALLEREGRRLAATLGVPYAMGGAGRGTRRVVV